MQGAQPFFRVDHERDRREPFVQRQVRIVEDRSCGGAELVSAFWILALVDDPARNLNCADRTLGVFPRAFSLVGLDAHHLGTAALQAGNAIRPTHRFKVIHAGCRGCKLFGCVYQVHSRGLYI